MTSSNPRAKQATDCLAKEKKSFDDILKGLPVRRNLARTVLSRLTFLTPAPNKTAMLDVGAAQGEVVIASRELGYRCIGLEPFPGAR